MRIDVDQTARKHRLVCDFAVRTLQNQVLWRDKAQIVIQRFCVSFIFGERKCASKVLLGKGYFVVRLYAKESG